MACGGELSSPPLAGDATWSDALMPGRRPRLFHAFCVGLPKTGTTSIRAIFENYRSAKLRGGGLKALVGDVEDGKRTGEDLRSFLLDRDRDEWLEMDASSGNWMVRELLRNLFPSAKFILTVRDCYSWCDSMLNVLVGHDMGNDFVDSPHLFRRFMGFDLAMCGSAESVLEHKQTIFSSLLAQWSEQDKTYLSSPRDRTLVVRTGDISSSLKRIAEFVGVPSETLMFERSHRRRTARKFNILKELDAGFLERVFSQCADSVVMKECYPEASLQRFLSTPEHVPVMDRYPVGYWINQAEAAVIRGQPSLAERVLGELAGMTLEPDETRRVDFIRTRIQDLQEAPEDRDQPPAELADVAEEAIGVLPPVSEEFPSLAPRSATGYREISDALSVVGALAERGALKRYGYRLKERKIHMMGGACCGLLVFTHGERHLLLEVQHRDPSKRHWVSAKRFSISYRKESPPAAPTDREMAKALLKAIEQRVR